jgi:hypothetical protein
VPNAIERTVYRYAMKINFITMDRFMKSCSNNTIHLILIEWGKWRECPQYLDHEIRRVDIHLPPGPSIPKGVPTWITPDSKRYDFWRISEWYDRLHHRSVLRSAIFLMYLQWPDELSYRQIAEIMDIHHDTAAKYVAQAQDRIIRYLTDGDNHDRTI